MAEQRYGRMPQKGTAESQAAKREELFDAGTGIVLDSLPVIGGFRGMGRAADEFKAGNNFMGALELAGAIPMVGLPIKAVAKAARGIGAAKPYRTDSRYIPQLPKNDPASRTNIPPSIAEDLSKEFDEFPLSGTQSVSFKNIEGQNVIDQVEVVDSFIRPVDVSKIKDRPDFSEVVSTAKIRELQDMGLVSKTLDPDVLDQELTQLALKNRTRIDSDTGVLYEPTVLLKVKKDSFIDAPARRGTYQDGPDGVNFEFVEVPLDTFEAMQKRRQQATLTSADNLPDADTFEVPIELQSPEFLDVNKSVGYRLGDDVLDGGYPSSINVGRGSSFEGGQDVAAEGIESFLDSLRNPPSQSRGKAPTFTTEDLMRAPANQPFAYGGVVQNYQNGGGIGYFERPEGEYGVEPSQFEQDVTQQPGRVYDTIFTPMSRAESVQHPLYGASEEPYEFDPAGGIMGMAGRALSTFDRKLSGLPVSDEQLAGAAMDIVPTSAGIASTAFGPAMLPGMLGAFSMKHGSGRLFNFFARNPKSTSDYTLLRERTAGPGTYLGDEEVAVGYARRFAERDFAGEEDVAYDVAFPFGVDIEDMRANPKKYDPDVIDDPKLREDTDRALSDVLEDANRRAESKVVDMDNAKIMYFFEDGSTLVRNLNPTQDGRPVIEPLGKGAGFVYDVMVNAEKEHFLDFSKPLFKQPDFVASKIQDLRRLVELDDKATGSQFYGKLKQKLGGEEEATKALIDLGIIGNRFEQRGKEMMVVFDPDNLSIEKTTPYERFADGGVVSLKDKAVNMTRGPRSNGIMQYVPYMTGATNGY